MTKMMIKYNANDIDYDNDFVKENCTDIDKDIDNVIEIENDNDIHNVGIGNENDNVKDNNIDY